MDKENIIEMAERYGQLETLEDQDTGCHVSKWVFSEEGLRKFAQSVIEEERERIKGRFELAAKKIWPTGLPKNAGYMTSFESSLSAFTHVLLEDSQDDI